MWGGESEAVAPIIWLYQTMDARKGEVLFPDLLTTLRRHAHCLSLGMQGIASLLHDEIKVNPSQ